MTRVWTVATLVVSSAVLGACFRSVPIEGATCPCPSGFCCIQTACVQSDATCPADGTDAGVAGDNGQAGAGGGPGAGGAGGAAGATAETGGTAGQGGSTGAGGQSGGDAGRPTSGSDAGVDGGDGGKPTERPDGGADAGHGFHAACDPSITDDDRAIHVTGPSQVTQTRSNLLQNIFGSTTLPNPTIPAANIHLNVSPSTVPVGLQNELYGLLEHAYNVGRVDMFEYPMKDADGNVVFTALGWHLIPASGGKNKLVIVHQGHDNTLLDPFPGEDAGGPGGRGLEATIDALLYDGYSVLAMYMPQYRPDELATPDHAHLMNDVQPQGGGSGTRFFMEPVRAFLLYLETNWSAGSFPPYTDVHMTGVDGGGWTTTVYAAIDPTIERSFPVAGSIPLYLRCPSGGAATYHHDAEQFQGNGIYHIAGYQDLYVLGATGTDPNGMPRHETQILDRLDDCCFGQAQQSASIGAWDVSVNQYELSVRQAVYEIGQYGMVAGMFRVEIDENDTTVDGEYHLIGHGEIFRTILGELDGARREIGRQAGDVPGNDNDAFYRGVDGHLWHRSISPAIEENTGIPIVGASDAAFAAGNPAPVFNVVTRNPHGAPVLASTFQSAGGWTYQALPGRLNSEPTIVSGQGNSELWIFGLGTNYLPYVWDANGNFAQISTTPVLGPLSASLRQFEEGFHVFYLAWDRSVVHSYRTNPQAPWQTEPLGGTTFGFVNGTVVPSTGDLVVFQLGTNGMLYWNRKANGDQTPSNPWTTWQSISEAADATGTVLTGTPSFSLTPSGTWMVFVPTVSNGLALFTSSLDGAWTFTDLGPTWIGAPTATATGVFTEGTTTGLWQWLPTGFSMVGGVFD